MDLKEYQEKALKRVRDYLEALNRWQDTNERVVKAAGVEAALDFPQKAWEEIVQADYRFRKNGLGASLPSFCLKIPTGGGKTLLAVKAIDLINTMYRKKQTGLILWIVPSEQIYRQTFQSLKNREHPYRQNLDIASAGRTLILEKTDRFTPLDVSENLAVLMLMLPSANRQTKESLRMFKDSGNFSSFFPSEDAFEEQKKLFQKFPNLDFFGVAGGLFGRQAKTSLGNALRILSPVIIMDEGHKAYSEGAQKTLLGFNPCLILELSATPSDESNILVDIKGVDLAKEEMIKLDLHVVNKAGADWKNALLAAKERRDDLEKKARRLRSRSGTYIRPICLIQVERTGKDQRGGRFIHAEDAREYLIKSCGVSPEEIAVKSSEKDDIDGRNLLAEDCPIRYIITKQALQEGWDCSFAYVLAILSNPGAKNSLTQLVGRILRQPEAKKTGVNALDESYVFCFQGRAGELLESVKSGFKREGLGDLHSRIIQDEDENGKSGSSLKPRTVGLREKFKRFENRIYLPIFIVREGNSWRKVSYEADILSRVDWSKANFSSLDGLSLSSKTETDTELAVALSEDLKEVIRQKGVERFEHEGSVVDFSFVARQLLDFIPNPWTAYDIAKKTLSKFISRFGEPVVSGNLSFIVEYLRKQAEKERDLLARQVFEDLLKKEELHFTVARDIEEYRIPSKIEMAGGRCLNRKDGNSLQLSLFESVPEEDFNSLEKDVAWYFEDQEKLLWWHRNLSRQDYSIQGWRKNRIYPDFIVADADLKNSSDYGQVYIVETKGEHLEGNADTEYKKAVFALCNQLAQRKTRADSGLEFSKKKISFELAPEGEWENRLNSLLGVRESA